MPHKLSALNTPQQQAVRYVDGPLLVLAGAGSGKTRVITAKIAYLLQSGIPAKHIAAITFTNKAAREMQERVRRIVSDEDANALTVTTFHSLGLRIIHSEAKRCGLKSGFSIFDPSDCEAIMSDILKTTDRKLIRSTQSIISGWKNTLLSPAQALQAPATMEDETQHLAAKTYERYQATLSAYQAVDFDDLIRLPNQIFLEFPEAATAWRERLRYILVDEYQDTNPAQYALLKHLAGERARFTAVGDDDQAIYGWRGASLDNLARLPAEFPTLQVIKLEQNYRSTIRILKSANRLIGNNPKLYPKKLWSDLGHGDPIHVFEARDDESEAESVVMKLLAHKFERKTQFRDYAILYRGNHQARIFEQQLRAKNVPYELTGGQSFFDRTEIKDLLAYLRLMGNSEDDPAFIRAATTPKRGIGAVALEKLGVLAGDRHCSLAEAMLLPSARMVLGDRLYEPLAQFVQFVKRLTERATREPAGEVMQSLIEAIAYERYLFDSMETRAASSRMQNVRDFVSWIGTKADTEGKTLAEIVQQIALVSMIAAQDETPDAVRLSTLHAAKGLEWPCVFIVGVEEGLLPHQSAVESGVIDEERRLMYVGITRAQRSLYISYCKKRKRAGEWHDGKASRFIGEMDQEDLRISGQTNPHADPVAVKAEGLDRLKAMRAMLGKS